MEIQPLPVEAPNFLHVIQTIAEGVFFLLKKLPEFVINIFYIPSEEEKVKTNPEFVHSHEPDFKYNWDGKTQIRTGNPQVDEYIHAYEILNIDIVKMILVNQQLVDFAFVKRRYRNLQKQHHPDRPEGSEQVSIELNLAYEKIDKLTSNEQEQFDLIRNIYLFYHPPEPGNAYLFLFIFGILVVFGLTLGKR